MFFQHYELEGADAESFEYLWGSFARDKNHAYSGDAPIGTCSNSTMQQLRLVAAGGYDRFLRCDSESIFCYDTKIEVRDSSKVQLLGDQYLSDGESIYFFSTQSDKIEPIQGVEIRIFQFVNDTQMYGRLEWLRQKRFDIARQKVFC